MFKGLMTPTRTDIKNLSSQNLGIVLEYHNSKIVFWLHAYQRRK